MLTDSVIRGGVHSCFCRCYIGVEEITTLEMLEKQGGLVSIESHSVNQGESAPAASTAGVNESHSTNVGEQNVPLISVPQIRQMSCDERGVPEEQLIMTRSRTMIRVGTARWYRRPSLVWAAKVAAEAGPTVGPRYG